MLGTFNNDQPVIEIDVKGVTGISKKVNALVDSGFNGYLQLPFVEAFPLGLVLAGVQANTLADGSTSSHLVCKGQVCIDGQCINTTIETSAKVTLFFERSVAESRSKPNFRFSTGSKKKIW